MNPRRVLYVREAQRRKEWQKSNRGRKMWIAFESNLALFFHVVLWVFLQLFSNMLSCLIYTVTSNKVEIKS